MLLALGSSVRLEVDGVRLKSIKYLKGRCPPAKARQPGSTSVGGFDSCVTCVGNLAGATNDSSGQKQIHGQHLTGYSVRD